MFHVNDAWGCNAAGRGEGGRHRCGLLPPAARARRAQARQAAWTRGTAKRPAHVNGGFMRMRFMRTTGSCACACAWRASLGVVLTMRKCVSAAERDTSVVQLHECHAIHMTSRRVQRFWERDLENRCRPQTGPRRWMAGVREEYVRMRMRTICACAQYDVPAPARRPHPAAHSGPSPWPATDGFGTADFRPPFLLPSPTGRS